MRASSEDLPAFGSPTSAASASSLSLSSSVASSPGSPVSAKRGVRRVGEAKRLLPRPAMPPRAATTRAPGAARSAISRAVLVQHLGADGHAQLDRLAGCSVFQRAAARLAGAGLEVAPSSKRRQIAKVWVCDQDDVAARATVPTIGPTLGHVLLTAEVEAAVAAATRLHLDAGAVLEHG